MLRAYKYRLYPNAVQRELIEQHFGACRLVYNLALNVRIETYRQTGKNISGFDLMKQLPDLKEGFPWMSNVNSQSLQASIINLDKAYKQFFKTKKGFPKFKSRRDKQTFQCPGNKREIDWEKETITVPKIDSIPIVLSRKFNGTIKTVTISKTPTGKYFASVLVDNHIAIPEKPILESNKTIGLDLGLKDFVITSNGIKYENPKYLKTGLSRLKYLQRQASKKIKGSSNRRRANMLVARAHERIANLRADYLQKLSTKLVCDNQTTSICVESLAVHNMIRNHNLAQAITDVSWSKFVDMLRYKCDWYGKNLIKIGVFEPSSKLCNHCGHKQELTLSHRSWDCMNCHETNDRDINAARNIKDIGMKNYSGKHSRKKPVELPVVQGALKQEIPVH